MAGQRGDAAFQQTSTGMKRRGILAAAGAVIAGIVAKQTSQPVGATSGGGADGNLVLGSNFINTPNTATTVTLLNDAPNFTAQSLFTLDASRNANTGTGTVASLTSVGRGTGVGVFGTMSPGGGGITPGGYPGLNAGVYGFSTTGGTGVVGHTTGTAGNTVGVKGLNVSTGASGIGVSGQCDATSGSIGVRGTSNLGFGVYGASNGGPGVFGTTTAAQNAALGGIVSTPGTAAFAGTATVPTAFAGFFTGDVFVNGNFTVQDPTRKHGAIQHPDGSHRILYSMESPESWIEDFGTGQLVDGKADVRLDPDFAAVVHTENYHVYLTMYDSAQLLYVTNRTAGGFVVVAAQAGASGEFTYRVVAKPKSENKAARLAKFTVPDIKVPQPPPMPNVPAATTPDTPPQAAPPSRLAPPGAAPPQGSGTTQGGTTSPVQPAPPPRP